MSQIITWIKYTKPYLPPRCRKYRYSNEEEYVPIELAKAKFDELIPAFVVEGDGRIYYLFHDQLYVKAEESDIWAKREGISALDALITVNRECSTYFGFGWQDSREKMIAKAESDMAKYLLVDGELYRIIGEPRYFVATFGMGNNHGGTALMVASDFNSNCDPASYFCALDADLAVAEANKVAAERSDTNDIGTFRPKIVVLLPDAVKLPRRSLLQSPLEPEPKEKVYVCPHCGRRLDPAQAKMEADDPNRWKFCPGCGSPIKWEAITPVAPGDINCEVCGCWLGTVRPDGSSYASSHYNGTGVCDSCMIEHCLAANCLACEIGKYPDCQFLDMKKFYQED